MSGSADDGRILAAAGRLGVERVVIAMLAARLIESALDVVAAGSCVIVAGLSAPSVRQGFARLASQLALVHPGASVEAARDALAESFDVVVETGRSVADGRARVVRVSELAGTDAKGVTLRDIFLSTPDVVGDAAFAATGTTPRLTQDFAARGVRLDPALFRRAK
jgi:hypothetical protein